MSTDVTMQELEFETAELLPARETLYCYCKPPCHQGSSVSFQQQASSGGNGNGTGNGNGNWGILDGNGNGIGNGSAINVNVF